MSAYLIAEVVVHDQALFEEYKNLVPATIAAYGGRYLTRGRSVETLEGDWEPQRFVIVEFPTTEQAKQWWASTEYSAAKQLRQRAAQTRMIVVESM
jgi:uncharacterized protein (DUF1330 family)